MYKPLTPAEITAVEKRIGRSLTEREKMFGELDPAKRTENRKPTEVFDASHWQPKMAEKKGGTVFDDAVASAEQAAEVERFNSLTMAQKRLEMMKKSQADELQRQADAATMKDHLAKIKPQLDKLNALKDSIRLDNSWSQGDLEAITRATRQLEAGPNADAGETARLYEQPFKILASKKQALLDEATSKRAELDSQIASLNAEKAILGSAALSAELASLTTAADAWSHYEKSFDWRDNDNFTPEKRAALDRWLELDRAERAAAESQQPAAT